MVACVAIVAGGTGGHVFPALSSARVFLRRGMKVIFFTDSRGFSYLADERSFPIVLYRTIPYQSFWSLGRVAFFFLFSCLRACYALLRHRIDYVVAFGGYTALPFVAMGFLLRRRLIAHEQNVILGFVNRWMLPFVDVLALGFSCTQGIKPRYQHKTHYVGTPLRFAWRHPVVRPAGRDDKLRLLVLGGSQGAASFADIVPHAFEGLDDALRRRFVVVQQCRSGQESLLLARYASLGIQAEVAPFFHAIDKRLESSDMVVSRAGASMLSELLVVGRAAVLIPYPHARLNHQYANARAVVERGFGWLVEESTKSGNELQRLLASVVATPELLSQRAVLRDDVAGRHNAAEHLADVTLMRST